jgi:hypothetical protein
MLKTTSDGDLLWAHQLGGDNSDWVSSVATDSEGNIYATGGFSAEVDEVDFDPGPGVANLTSIGSRDAYLVKYTPSGDLVWVKQWGGSGAESGLFLDIDTAANLYVVTHFQHTTDMDPGPNVFNLTSLNVYDASISKLNADGDFVWAKQIAGESNPLAHGGGFAVDANVNIYTAGSFHELIDLDPSPVDSFIVVGEYTDMFIMKLGYCPVVYESISETSCIEYQSPSGYYNWNESGTYLDVIPASTGCDSVLYIDLTIDSVNANVFSNGMMLTAEQDTGLYQWLDCNNGFMPISSETAQTYQPISSGSYAVEIISDGCIDTSSCYEILTVGINNMIGGDASLSYYPNPTTGQLVIAMHSSASITSIEVFNSVGQAVLKRFGNGESSQSIDLTPLENGLYFIHVQSDSQQSVLRIVKQ